MNRTLIPRYSGVFLSPVSQRLHGGETDKMLPTHLKQSVCKSLKEAAILKAYKMASYYTTDVAGQINTSKKNLKMI